MSGKNSGTAPVPSCLRRVCARHIALGILFAVLAALLLVRVRTPQCLLGFGIAGWLAYPVFGIVRDCRTGRITEQTVICTGVHYPAGRRLLAGGTTRAVFRPEEDEEAVRLRFDIPGTVRAFEPGARYRIYYRPSRPDRLLGYEEQ